MSGEDFGCTLGLSLFAAVLFVGCVLILDTHGIFDEPIYPSVEMETLRSGGISVPAGYVLSAMVESPNHTDEVVMFCTNTETRQLVPCTNGVIGEPIDIEDGYTVIQAFRQRQERKYISFICQSDVNPADIKVCARVPSIKNND